MSETIYVRLWEHASDSVGSWAMNTAKNALEQTMDPQFDDISLSVVDYSDTSGFPAYSGVTDHDSGEELIESFAHHVNDNITWSTFSREIHLLVFWAGSSFSDLPFGEMQGSVGSGNGYQVFDEEGAAGIVNTYSYDGGITYGSDFQGAYENTVMHEVYHALTDSDASYFDPPDDWCGSGTDHSTGTIHDNFLVNSVTPMATWYTEEALNDPPCLYCGNKYGGKAGTTTQSFTDCAIDEAEKHMNQGV